MTIQQTAQKIKKVNAIIKAQDPKFCTRELSLYREKYKRGLFKHYFSLINL